MKHKLSIIIPIFNEAKTIGNLLQHILDNSTSKQIAEIIIVDGGSIDGSQDILRAFISSRKSKIDLDTNFSIENSTRTDIKLLTSEKGRAKQMNLGAKSATGNILYFLHADSFPPKHFDTLIINEVNKGNQAGCFKMRFDHNHWWLNLASWLTHFKWRACRGGDQSQFITKKLFNELNGFDERFSIYEDNDLINKLYAQNEFVVIQEWITTSARRYNVNGIWKLQYHFWAIYIKKWFGASPEVLNQYYIKNII